MRLRRERGSIPLRRRANQWVLLLAAATVLLTGCQGDMLSTAEFKVERQQQVDEMTALGAALGVRPVDIAQQLNACFKLAGEDPDYVQANYFLNLVAKPDTVETLDKELRPRMEAEGWNFRDRSQDANRAPEDILNYYWTRDEQMLNVTLSQSPGLPKQIVVDSLSRCADRGELRDGQFYPGDDEFVAPAVPGPRYEDVRPLK